MTAVKLVVGFIFQKKEILPQALRLLKKRFGKIDFQSQILAFRHTSYYEKEFGKNLKRCFISFQEHIAPDSLAQIKITTKRIEKKLAKNNLRQINIDPGYLTPAKLVLASTKDYRHRIYLNKGIYAEVTLYYQNKTFRAWEWTYPDYKTGEYIAIFNRIREIYVGQVQTK